MVHLLTSWYLDNPEIWSHESVQERDFIPLMLARLEVKIDIGWKSNVNPKIWQKHASHYTNQL